ncbi:Tellurium resistance protein TerD [hydrothermal vent metagenome]|uniref:Tellurium resistance protein TerD n=1 Tax=hydrothermal vent metagenome TaxID=652676 RepID=A0A1W1BW31_9ZZZZ
MAISLSKGGRVSLSKEAPGLKNIKVGLGWDANATDTGTQFDLDASLFLLGADGKVVSDEHFIFYNNTTSPDGAVVHQGDNRTGEGDGDDESIEIDLSKIAPEVDKIVFTVTIDEADSRGQNFGQVNNSFIRILNQDGGTEIAKYELDEDYSSETAINFGELYRKNGGWNFKAVGAGFNEGLAGFCKTYGVSI